MGTDTILLNNTHRETVDLYDSKTCIGTSVEAAGLEPTRSMKRPDLQSGEPTNCSTLPIWFVANQCAVSAVILFDNKRRARESNPYHLRGELS